MIAINDNGTLVIFFKLVGNFLSSSIYRVRASMG